MGYFGSEYFLMLQGSSIATTRKHAYPKVYVYYFHDCSGFWEMPLHAESSKLTTFITPFRRFWFRRLPFGIFSAPEIFQRLMSNLFHGKPGTKILMDDILVHGITIKEHGLCLEEVLDTVE